MDPISFIIMIVAYLFGKEIMSDKPAKKKPDDGNGESDEGEVDDRPFFQTVVLRDRDDD